MAASDTRSAFNIKVLKRHDPSIEDILHSASFVVLYLYNSAKGAWSKSGIEGPMFLFRRAASPHYGIFVLNRNGVENFCVPLTQDDDIEITDDFTILRTESDTVLDEDDDEEKIIGVWVFEKEQRQAIGDAMVDLQTRAASDDNKVAPPQQPLQACSNAAPAAASEANAGQSISLDALFASAPQRAQTSPHPPHGGPAPLSSARQEPPAPQAPSRGLPLLDAIFQSAATPASSAPPQHSTPEPRPVGTQASRPSPESATDPAAGLMAMLGLSSPSKSSHPSAPAPPPTAPTAASNAAPASSASPVVAKTTSGVPQTAVPALQTLFNGASAATASTPPAPLHQHAASTGASGGSAATGLSNGPGQGSSTSGQTEPVATAEPFRDTSRELLSEQIAKTGIKPATTGDGAGAQPAMTKTEFVREILALIHTDKTFTADLYEAYLSRR